MQNHPSQPFHSHQIIKLWIASCNPHKIRELKALLSTLHASLSLSTPIVSHSLQEIPSYAAPEENGKSFLENAHIKVKNLMAQGSPFVQKKDWILGEDSGLEVSCLQGQPGIRSARYAGSKATDKANNLKLLQVMEGQMHRKARFICQIVLATTQGIYAFRGTLDGFIAKEMRSTPESSGFGYDPLFIPLGQKKSLAQLGKDYKKQHSHRSLAMAKLFSFLEKSSGQIFKMPL